MTIYPYTLTIYLNGLSIPFCVEFLRVACDATRCIACGFCFAKKESFWNRTLACRYLLILISRNIEHGQQAMPPVSLILIVVCTIQNIQKIIILAKMRHLGLFLCILALQLGVIESERVDLDLILNADSEEVHYVRGENGLKSKKCFLFPFACIDLFCFSLQASSRLQLQLICQM